MATAPTQQGFRSQLPPLTSFLTLAPATSSSYPTPHRRTDSDSSITSTSSVVTPSAPSVAQDQDQVQDQVAASVAVTIPAAIAAAVVTVTPAVKEEKKFRRSSSLSSQSSSRSAGQFRFLRLGPVHHGAHIEGDGDWSEEVAVSE